MKANPWLMVKETGAPKYGESRVSQTPSGGAEIKTKVSFLLVPYFAHWRTPLCSSLKQL